ncbi:hypothetical protein [Pontimicrobium aquaticum]|uniref:Uncharacterized protein n=1 Tax=Pontimicrobium aquaticum TaxID=2565367 RepID=A0A4U0EP87_9FLAO|nr:hypothetical protein [Pontimicrobium aquaticum]TJY33381.1 hypothetical protein E5167_12840 [Pontimicrobium aquaticum]
MNFIKKYWSYILGAILLLYLVIRYYKIVSGKNFEDLPQSDKLSQTGSTLTDEQSKVIADNLYKAMVSYLWGTDEKIIFNEFAKLKSGADFNKVYNAFGLRQYSTTWGNVGDPFTSEKHNLITILTNELTSKEQNKLRASNPYLSIF